MKKAFFTVLASLAVFAVGSGSVFACTTNGNNYGYNNGYYSNHNYDDYNNNYNYSNAPCNYGVNYNNYPPVVYSNYSVPVYTTSPATLYPNNYVYGYNDYDNAYIGGNSGTTYSVSNFNGNYNGYNYGGYVNYNGYNGYGYNSYNNYNDGYNDYNYNNYNNGHRRETCISCHVKSDPRCKICYR